MRASFHRILSDLRRIVSSAASRLRVHASPSGNRDAIFDEAANNLPHGIVVWDKERRVVFCNMRYRDIYHLTPDRTKPGTSVGDLIRHRFALGLVTPNDPEDYVRERMSKPVTPLDAVHEFADGRTVAYFVRPMSDGGGIAIHEDIWCMSN